MLVHTDNWGIFLQRMDTSSSKVDSVHHMSRMTHDASADLRVSLPELKKEPPQQLMTLLVSVIPACGCEQFCGNYFLIKRKQLCNVDIWTARGAIMWKLVIYELTM